MRIIKFRAWDKVKKEMVYEGVGTLFGRTCIDSGEECISLERKTYMKQLPLMQYTGLKDKNGIEIYEGDIVKTKISSKLTIIEWSMDWGNRIGFNISGKRNFHEKEVIGNIYENKELLK